MVALETRTLSGQASRSTFFQAWRVMVGSDSTIMSSKSLDSTLEGGGRLVASPSLPPSADRRLTRQSNHTDQAVQCGAPNAELPCGLQGTLAGIRGEAC